MYFKLDFGVNWSLEMIILLNNILYSIENCPKLDLIGVSDNQSAFIWKIVVDVGNDLHSDIGLSSSRWTNNLQQQKQINSSHWSNVHGGLKPIDSEPHCMFQWPMKVMAVSFSSYLPDSISLLCRACWQQFVARIFSCLPICQCLCLLRWLAQWPNV